MRSPHKGCASAPLACLPRARTASRHLRSRLPRFQSVRRSRDPIEFRGWFSAWHWRQMFVGSPFENLLPVKRPKGAPQAHSTCRAFSRVHVRTSRLNAGLFRSSSCDELAGIDERKRLGIVAALKIDRLVLDAVDVNRLARVQADANARHRIAAFIGTVPHHDVDGAMAPSWLVKRDDALTANRREDGLVRPDGPQVLSKVFGSGGETGRERNESARSGEPQEPASI